MYDTDIALAMEKGEIEGIVDKGDYYLVNLRITGTGIKTRIIDGKPTDIDRVKEYFLSAHFLQECRGLPVTVEHPEERVNKDTFGECVIGTVFHPYVRGEEVWGVAKIYDTATVRDIIENQPSTSPNVLSANLFFKTGEPRLEDYESINHVAIVREGFWDNGKPAIIVKGGDMSEDNSNEEEKKEEKSDEASTEDYRDSVASSVRTDTEEKVDSAESKEAKLAVEEKDNREEKEKEDSMEDKEKSDDLSKEAKVAESERDNRLEKDEEKKLHEEEKDKKDSDLYERIAQLEAELATLKEVEQAEGDEWDILANEHEELSDEHLETEALEEEMIETRDALYEGVRSNFKVLRASRREKPEMYMLRSIRANQFFLSDENKELAQALHPRTHSKAVRRLYGEFKDSVKQVNVRSIGEADADIPMLRKEDGVIYDDNYLSRIVRKVGGK